MNAQSRIYIAGHRGMVGSAITRALSAAGLPEPITFTSAELDLRNQAAVQAMMNREQPTHVFVAAAKVGGIHANNVYRADFLYDNLMIDQMVRIHADNVGRLRSAMATTLNPSCLSRLGECLVRLQQQYLQHMAEWASHRVLDTAETVPMREEWSPAAFAAALETERKGETLDQATASRLATELLRMRTLTRDALPV